MHAEKQLPVKKLTAMFESPKLIERKKEADLKRRKSTKSEKKQSK